MKATLAAFVSLVLIAVFAAGVGVGRRRAERAYQAALAHVQFEVEQTLEEHRDLMLTFDKINELAEAKCRAILAQGQP